MNSVLPGQIWLVKFHPAVGSELAKYRPVVVVQDLSKIDDRFVTIIPLTSDTHRRHKTEISIKNAALEKPSLALCWYWLTIDRRRLQARLGTLQSTELEKVGTALSWLIKN